MERLKGVGSFLTETGRKIEEKGLENTQVVVYRKYHALPKASFHLPYPGKPTKPWCGRASGSLPGVLDRDTATTIRVKDLRLCGSCRRSWLAQQRKQ